MFIIIAIKKCNAKTKKKRDKREERRKNGYKYSKIHGVYKDGRMRKLYQSGSISVLFAVGCEQDDIRS